MEKEREKLIKDDMLTLNITIDENTQKLLMISIDDDIYSQIENFCIQNNLSDACMDKIKEVVEATIEKELDITQEKLKAFESQGKIKESESELKRNLSPNYQKEKEDKKNEEINLSNNKNKPKKKLKQSKSSDQYENIYDVHYNPYKYDRLNYTNKKLNLDKNNRSFVLGKQMYDKEMKRLEIKKKKAEQMKRQIVAEEDTNNKFKPEIEKNSSIIASNLRSKSPDLKIEDRLLDYGKRMQKKKLQKMLDKKMVEEAATPKEDINNSKLRKNHTARSKLGESHFSGEFREKRKKAFDEEYQKTYCFKPEIHPCNIKFDQNYFNKLKEMKEQENNEIQISLKKKREERQRKMSEFNKTNIEIAKYYENKELKDKISQYKNEISNLLEKKHHWLRNTAAIITKMKISKYKEIFDLLDGDQDGYIAYDCYSLKDFDKENLEIISPLLNAITEKQMTQITFKEFVPLADEYLQDKIFYDISEKDKKK